MEKIPSQILIYKRGKNYYCDAYGCFGGGYSGVFAGKNAEEAALFALREKGRYIDTNKLGGNIIVPQEVREKMQQFKLI